MQAPHSYPVGVQTFEEIRSEGCLYVDKTRYVYEMASTPGKYYFLSRPRRFGKSLLVSTMEAYFQGRRELFEGLAIAELEQDWTCHPVIRFDLSDIKATTAEELEEQLSFAVGLHEREYGIAPESTALADRVFAVVSAAAEQTGERAVVLVDEYDVPMLNVLHAPDRLQAFRETMRKFYAPLKKLAPSLRFVFLTGITKFSQLSVFSELNNLRNVSMLPQFASVCGITEDELRSQMPQDIAYLGERLGLAPEDAYAALKDKYDGYRFCADGPDVYNPFSLMCALADGQLGSYWYASGTPTSLVEMLKSGEVEIPELDGGIDADASDFDAPTESAASPKAFMYQAGYLTIKDYDAEVDSYTLGIPDKEVADGLYKSLLPACTGASSESQNSFITKFARFVRTDDMDGALGLLRAFLSGIPYGLAPTSESGFQTLLFVLFKVVGAKIGTEVRTSSGRIDAVLESRSCIYVMELKYGGSAEEALAQIDSKGYAIPWEAGEKRVFKVGINFSPESRTIEEGWIIEEA